MSIDRSKNPAFLNDYLTYLDVIRGKAQRTVVEYYNDIVLFLCWNHCRIYHKSNDDIADQCVLDVTLDELRQTSLADLYDFIRYLRDVRGNTPRSVARRMCAVRSMFKYLKLIILSVIILHFFRQLIIILVHMNQCF